MSWMMLSVLLMGQTGAWPADMAQNPFDRQVAEKTAELKQKDPAVRMRACESLGFLRSYAAEAALLAVLRDPAAEVRRAAALSLGWCGGRKSLAPLLAALEDSDPFVRRSAYIALTNLTGMELPDQPAAWRAWIAALPEDPPSRDVLELLAGPRDLAAGAIVTASSTYKGPADVLTGRSRGTGFWQTKNVPFPQWCQIDLGRSQAINQVALRQYGPGYLMTEYEISAGDAPDKLKKIVRRKAASPAELVVDFPATKARYVRITSYASEKATYPTTFRSVEIYGPGGKTTAASAAEIPWRQERGYRALGALGGRGATEAILESLGPNPTASAAYRPAVRAAIRSLGRLREEAGFQALIRLLENPMWARAAADALGDFGDRRAVPALLAAYPRYAKSLAGQNPVDLPADDHMSFPSEDRMLETPYAIALALCRLPIDSKEDRESLRKLAPLIMANLPGDHDTFVLYRQEVPQLLTRCLMERSGLRQEALEYAFESLGQPRRVKSAAQIVWPKFPQRRMSTWLPALVAERADLPRLLALVRAEPPAKANAAQQNHVLWTRLNAAKAIGWLGDRSAIGPLAAILAAAKSEADYGFSPLFKDEEFDDPCPRWREGPIRALGLLRAAECVPLLVKILNDEGSVMEIRLAAAEALADVGNPNAMAALKVAAQKHPIHAVRNAAREAVGLSSDGTNAPAVEARPASTMTWPDPKFDALLFVQGDNDLPNSKRTVEQADRWRQTYVVTDEGPSYRPGENLMVLRPPRPDGKVTPLTNFRDGYVGEPEISWDGRTVVFTRRGGADPWWHVWTVGVDGKNLRQLTFGPYHDVGPAFLPDGRIIFASTRLGARDEYHGYPCTSLHVMNTDGSAIQLIAVNIGRDNEPAVLPDGRIAFSRLEVFYSRNKTELTLHAIRPDGTEDTVLYGPERRLFWRTLDHGEKAPDDGQESPLTHRVLRMTQPQPMPDGRNIVVATQAGLALVGTRRDAETLLMPDFKTRAYTTPFPLADGTILCASTLKTPDRKKVNLGLYRFDPASQRLDLIYDDPKKADYEPRPIVARRPPASLPQSFEDPTSNARLLCTTAMATLEPEVKRRGRLVRVIEGVPVPARHATHTGPDEVWKNHGGTHARILGTAPLAADGSFYLEVPADRLLHLQVLDSDRRVVGNQLTWMSARPGETKSCVGCHENPNTTTVGNDPLASHEPPIRCLPTGHEFTYRAKAWFKGSLPSEIEERTRTVHAVNLLGR